MIGIVALATVSLACGLTLRKPGDFGLNPGQSNNGRVTPSPRALPVEVSQATVGPTPTLIPASQRTLVDEEDQVLENIYQRDNPGVVYIEISQSFSRQQGGGVAVTGSASGFVIDKQGHIVTNNHVVDQADQLDVTFADGTMARAAVVKQDPANDLAVIQVNVPPGKLVPLELGDSASLRPGQRVVAIGNPFGLVGTMTEGIISAVGRALPASRSLGNALTNTDVIQTDAAINPGNSGGPLLDLQGNVIGVNTAIEVGTTGFGQPSGSGIGFAVPVNTVKQLVASIAGGR